MFKDVQKRLTVLYTLTMGAILMVLLSFIFVWNISRKEKDEEIAFQLLWGTVSTHLQTEPVFSDAYLAQTELTNVSVIHVEENGSPLKFSGSYSTKTPRSRLIEQAFEISSREGVYSCIAPVSSSVNQTSTFRMKGEEGDSYHGRLMVFATGTGSKSLLLLTSITPHLKLLAQSAPPFFFTCFAGILCILIVSWFFIGWSLKPARMGAKKQTDFIAAASHELRSPLAVIRSGTAALEDMVRENTAARKISSGIDRECCRMARLISDMLLLASSDARTWSLQRSDVDIETFLIETYEAFLPICREKNLGLSLNLPEEPLPALFADSQRLTQILAILMDNAVSYTPQGQSITLKCYLESNTRKIIGLNKKAAGSSDHFIIEVMDRGPGIPDSQKQLIFDRFYQADTSRSDKAHFGLGLSIAKELVQNHGGTICVLDREGGGSCFVVRL